MYFPSKLAKLSDDPEEGYFQGNIISIIYKGDHYNYRVLSENKVEYSVDDEDLWNIGDFVSVVVPEDAMVFESVSEDAEMKNDRLKSILGIPYFLFLVIFVVCPVLILLYYAFTNGAGEFSLANFYIVFYRQ